MIKVRSIRISDRSSEVQQAYIKDAEEFLNTVENKGGTILNITSDGGYLLVVYRDNKKLNE